MSYQSYINLEREMLLGKIAEQMSYKRFSHVLGVEKTAIALAEHYGGDADRAGLAALLHDYTKEWPNHLFLTVINEHGLDPTLKQWGNNIWHGLLAPYILPDELGVTDEAILQAIARHTVGASKMTLLDKILYVADYIEPGRDFPQIEEARAIAYESLDKAVAFATANTIAFLAQKAQPIFPQTLNTYNAFVVYLKNDKDTSCD